MMRITRLVVSDIDGTVADDAARNVMPPSQYFTPNVIKDLPANLNVLRYLKEYMKRRDTMVYLLTGRDEGLRAATTDWMRKFEFNAGEVELLMRPETWGVEFVGMFKLHQILQLMKQYPDLEELVILEDLVETLALLRSSLPPKCCTKLFLVQDGVVKLYSEIGPC
jgi:hypothetical protein